MAFPTELHWGERERTLDAVVSWVQSERAQLVGHLDETGALLFRGFPVHDPADFDAFVASFGFRDFSYAESLSNAVRIPLSKRVFTANEAPSGAVIALHHELAQTPHHPTHLFFRCDRPADRGGATTLCPSVTLTEKLGAERPEFARKCEQLGFIYRTRMPAADDLRSGQGRSWQSTLGVASVEEAQQVLSKLGYRGQWLPDGELLTISPPLPALIRTPSGRTAFFNQLIAAWLGWRSAGAMQRPVTFGDGSPIDDTDVRAAIEIADALSVDIEWYAGDIALIDNRTVMHGRCPFEGERRVWAAFGIESAP